MSSRSSNSSWFKSGSSADNLRRRKRKAARVVRPLLLFVVVSLLLMAAVTGSGQAEESEESQSESYTDCPNCLFCPNDPAKCVVDRIPEEPPPPPPPPKRFYAGGVNYSIKEQFGITATETSQGFMWVTEGGSVTDSRHLAGECYASAFPTWTIVRCEHEVINNFPNQASQVLNGTFSHSSGIFYEQQSLQTASPNNWAYSCILSAGSLPWLWHGECRGAYKQLD